MQLNKKTYIKMGVVAFLVFLAICYRDTLFGALLKLMGATLPLLIGFCIAYVLNILMSFYERHYFPKYRQKPIVYKSRRVVCLLASLLTLAGILALVICLVIPELVQCIETLVREIPPAFERLLAGKTARVFLSEKSIEALRTFDWQTYSAKLFSALGSGIGNVAGTVFNAVSTVVSGVTTGVIAFVFALYLLLNKERCIRAVKRVLYAYLPEKANWRILRIGRALNESFHGFIVGQCTEAVIIGVLCILGMQLLGFPYAVMIGTLVGFLALIPIAGAYIGAIVGAIMICTVSPFKALMFIVFIIVLQQLEDNLIYPRVVSGSIGLPAFLVIAAITVGGGLFGIPGMLIGVPLAATVYRLVKENVAAREKNRKKEKSV